MIIKGNKHEQEEGFWNRNFWISLGSKKVKCGTEVLQDNKMNNGRFSTKDFHLQV
jgi:hypothetical protein